MLCVRQEIGTSTILHGDNYWNCIQREVVEDKYRKCGLMNIIQHIDICGSYKTTYREQYRTKSGFNKNEVLVTSISSTPSSPAHVTPNASLKQVDSKISRFSIVTKVSGLYPGNDILSKRPKKYKLVGNKSSYLTVPK
ncbi:unnamed protein product [Spodoptera littoralis]|uniref:Uncharacterized protein n=1 Tax=Spodoptera littoralis TaxID=7109 RepID=A0A9P0IIK2_SPOLI|nr:unnamed protein product [Spodoptera littoralis]CAH1647525.1 unnamed protein product [Spodoptera littoralis]